MLLDTNYLDHWTLDMYWTCQHLEMELDQELENRN